MLRQRHGHHRAPYVIGSGLPILQFHHEQLLAAECIVDHAMCTFQALEVCHSIACAVEYVVACMMLIHNMRGLCLWSAHLALFVAQALATLAAGQPHEAGCQPARLQPTWQANATSDEIGSACPAMDPHAIASGVCVVGKHQASPASPHLLHRQPWHSLGTWPAEAPQD